MALFTPLRALRPLPERAAEIAELPYDVMDRAEAATMADGRPHSFLHVSRPDIDVPDGTPSDSPAALASARAAFDRLQSEGLLRRDDAPAFHVYRLTTRGRSQTGIAGLADVAAYDSGRIRKHETTRPAKQADRAAHIEALDAQTGPAFLIHRVDARIAAVVAAVTAHPAETSFSGPGGVHHEVWPLADPASVAELTAAFDDLDALYIADGHHRSAAASLVHAHRGTPASAGFLAVAFPADEVAILPYNRVVRFPPGLDVQALHAQVAERFAVEASTGPVTPAAPRRFGMYAAGQWSVLTAPADLHATAEPSNNPADPTAQLDVALLQTHVLDPVLGITDPRTDPRIGFVGGIRPLTELSALVDSGTWDVAFSMFPTTVADLIGVADAGGIMPPKSTWFEPKLLDGLVSHVLH